MTSKNLAGRLRYLESQLLPKPATDQFVVQIVYVSPDGTSEDGEKITITNPYRQLPYRKLRP